MHGHKPFLSRPEQLELLVARGMCIHDERAALAMLDAIGYYRLSGYWYPFRRIDAGQRSDEFLDGTDFRDVIALYAFDEQLRNTTFAALAAVEVKVRAALGDALGRLHPCAHLDAGLLGPAARSGGDFEVWRARLVRDIERSREDSIAHHRRSHRGVVPVWVAVEVLDWGGLTRLFSFAPSPVQESIAEQFALRAPQLASWLRALNIVRNVCAHHGRLFNRVYTKQPRLQRPGAVEDIDAVRGRMNRTFGQLTLIQFLREVSGLGVSVDLIHAVRRYPRIRAAPISRLGAPDDWVTSSLWSERR